MLEEHATFTSLAIGAAYFVTRKGLLPISQRSRIALACAIGFGLALIFWLIDETPISGRAVGLWLMQAFSLTGAALGVFYNSEPAPQAAQPPVMGPPEGVRHAQDL